MSDESSKRGFFQHLPKEVVREIAKKGGKAAAAAGTSHRWSSESARAAGRKGAASRQANRQAITDKETWNDPNESSDEHSGACDKVQE